MPCLCEPSTLPVAWERTEAQACWSGEEGFHISAAALAEWGGWFYLSVSSPHLICCFWKTQ